MGTIAEFVHKKSKITGDGTLEIPFKVELGSEMVDAIEAVMIKLRSQEGNKGLILKYPTGSRYMYVHLKKQALEQGADFHSYDTHNQTVLRKDLQVGFEILGIGSPSGFEEKALKEANLYREASELFTVLEDTAAEVFK